MPVPLETPYVRPSVAGKSFPSQFFTDFAVNAKSPTEGDIFIQSVPMADDGELATEIPTTTRCNLWDAIAAIPDAALAFQAVMKALPQVEAWAKAQ
ncbi:MAG: hypothetical protein WCL08_06085 [Verrucomicrobiota bacterium]